MAGPGPAGAEFTNPVMAQQSQYSGSQQRRNPGLQTCHFLLMVAATSNDQIKHSNVSHIPARAPHLR